MEITCTDGLLRIRSTEENGSQVLKEKQVAHPGDTLREILNRYKSPVLEELPPFTGGLVGYFSYDYIKYSEPKLKLDHGEDVDFRDMDLMLFDQVIAFDHYKQKVMLITGVRTDDLEESYAKAEKTLDEMAELIRRGEKKEFKPLKLNSEITPQFPEESYCRMVEKARHYIHEGDIFQVVLSNPMRAKAEGSLFDTYRVLRASNPSPYMFYFNSDDIEIAGASPETLVKLEKKKLSTFPLAGTRPRGRDKAEDKALEESLRQDEKELSEHNMLVDLGRNDIGKISTIGSVQVEKYMTVERFSHVMHLGSTVVGDLKEGKDAVDAVDAILPAGTLSGAPKFRACQIIEELEQSKRGIYGGAIGYLDFAGNLDTCIAIRLVYKKEDEICIRSGAGIVADSVPEKEYQECINKARAVVNAIETAVHSKEL
jgi:anthranilate synthase component 1